MIPHEYYLPAISPVLLSAVLSILLVYVSCGFLISLFTKNNGLADVLYGPGILLVSLSAYLLSFTKTTGALVIVGAVLVWSVRLATRIYRKNRGKAEDFRYKTWRDTWGNTFLVRSYFQIYILQGVIMVLVAAPSLTATLLPSSSIFLPAFIFGMVLWVSGFVLEARADYELDTFIREVKRGDTSRGKIMKFGLWAYSRHPNYFGESLQWWGLAVAATGVSSLPLFAYISPVLITFLLLKVSGVPLLEKHFEGDPEWEEYKTKTSVFFPRSPQKILL